jgi:hypothetical protein
VLSGSPSSAASAWRSLSVVDVCQGFDPTTLHPEVFLELPPPRSLRPRDNPLVGSCPPTESTSHVPPAGLSAPAPPMGFRPLQRMQHRESALPEACHSLGTFRLQGFAPSCRVTPPSAFRVYFTPVALMGFCPSGASPSKEPRHLVGVRLALVAFLPNRASGHGTAGRGRLRRAHLGFAPRPSLRLQGLAPPGSPCAVALAFTLATRRSPRGLFPPDGFPLIRGWDGFRRPSSRALRRTVLPGVAPRVHGTPAPQSIPPRMRWHCLSRDRLAVSRFRASDLLASEERA